MGEKDRNHEYEYMIEMATIIIRGTAVSNFNAPASNGCMPLIRCEYRGLQRLKKVEHFSCKEKLSFI